VMSYLGDFLFAPERARSPVRSLSGGERNRLLLARLFARPANVLVLDEPTNDLDIDTLELLESLLEDYSGTVFLVSHDRAFLDNVVTQTFAWEGEGVWREYVGGYRDWETQRARSAALALAATTASATSTPTSARGEVRRPGAPSAKLSYKEQRELDDLPGRINTLESEQAAIAARLADPELYKSGKDEMRTLHERSARIEEELMVCLERWEALEARRA